jgi:hypothetical protein
MVIVDQIIWCFCTIWWLNCQMVRKCVQPLILDWLNTEQVQWLPIHMLIMPTAA